MDADTTPDSDAPLTVILLEDSPLDLELVQMTLEREGIPANILHTDDGATFARLIQDCQPDLILSDYYLPAFDGPQALTLTRKYYPNVPFIFVSGTMGEDIAIEALKQGATDYVLKHRLERLGPAIRRALAEFRLRRERERVAEALRESESRFRRLADGAPVLIWVTGPNGELQYTNRSFTQFAGEESLTLDETGWIPLVHPEEIVQVAAEFQEVHRQSGEFQRVVRLRGRAGDYRWFQATGTPRVPVAGAFAGLVGTLSDVTDLKIAEQQAIEADRRKDEFLAVLAHELRNPLAPIRNSLQILKLSPEGKSPTVRAAREMMERQVKQLVRLVDDLLDVSRISRNKIALQQDRVELTDILSAAVEAALPTLEAYGHKLQILPEPLPTLTLMADHARLAQVFTNLLTNAAKYTPAGGRVAIAVIGRRDEAEIRVADSGIGIAPEDLGRIFEPFAQADRVVGRVTEGLGVGLSLVKRLVELHGGSVAVSSEGPGRGSTFTVRLPAIQGPTQTTRIPMLRLDDTPLRRILVLDDLPDNAASLGELLRVLGMEVCVVRDGQSALREVESFRPEVALLDLGLPGMDGFEVARRMKQLANPPILIAVSGYAQPEDRARSADTGFVAHLAKPIDLEELKSVLIRTTPPQKPAQ